MLFGLSIPRLILALGFLIISWQRIFITVNCGKIRSGQVHFLISGLAESRFSRSRLVSRYQFCVKLDRLFSSRIPHGGIGQLLDQVRPAMVFVLLAGIATLTVFFIRRSKLTLQDLKNSGTLGLSLGSIFGKLVRFRRNAFQPLWNLFFR